MDIWERLCEAARREYHPEEITPFVTAHHVAAAVEAEDGRIFTGFCIEGCSGVMNLCAERVAWLNMYIQTGQTAVRRMVAFRDAFPDGDDPGSGMPCGACREFLMQVDAKNADVEILKDFETRTTVTLRELLPNWWGYRRYGES